MDRFVGMGLVLVLWGAAVAATKPPPAKRQVSGKKAAARFASFFDAAYPGGNDPAREVGHQLSEGAYQELAQVRKRGVELLEGAPKVASWTDGHARFYEAPGGSIKVNAHLVRVRRTTPKGKATLVARRRYFKFGHLSPNIYLGDLVETYSLTRAKQSGSKLSFRREGRDHNGVAAIMTMTPSEKENRRERAVYTLLDGEIENSAIRERPERGPFR
jgi:hypothetical protein